MRLACLLLCLLFTLGSARAAAPAIGEIPPPLLGKDRDGREFDLAKARGKVVVVTFWASWCTYCLRELPALNDVQAKTGHDFLEIVAVNVKDDNNDYRAMTKQMKGYTLTLTRDKDGAIAERYGVNTYPNLWIIDPQGRVASRHAGYGEDSLGKILDEVRRIMREDVERRQRAATPSTADPGPVVGS